VTFQPLLLAHRRISTEPAVETWHTCRRESTWAGEQHVSRDHRLLGDRRPSGEAEHAGQVPLVHLRTLGEPGLLGVLGDDAVERLDVLQRPAHEHCVGHALSVVGEDPHTRTRVGHRAQLSQTLPAQAHGHGTDRAHLAPPGGTPELPDLLDDACGVGDRVGVGHRMQAGETASRRSAGTALHRLGVLPAGLAQVGVQVDQPGQRDEAVGIDALSVARIGTGIGADGSHHAVAEQQICGRVTQQTRTAYQDRAHEPLRGAAGESEDGAPARSR
jgi:hypothetical protein